VSLAANSIESRRHNWDHEIESVRETQLRHAEQAPMICSPTFLIDKKICQSNILTMMMKARHNQLSLRPHFKTHQNKDVGQWFREQGVEKITVSSLDMAESFIEAGWRDITVAFPVNIREMDRINQLRKMATLQLLVESIEAVSALEKSIESPLVLFIKIDVDYHRTGVSWEQSDQIAALVSAISKANKLSFAGFLTHAGNSYNARSESQIKAIHNQSLFAMAKLKSQYKEAFPDLIVSVGDTPTCSTMSEFPGVDEIRPGNFVYYDLSQLQIGSCQPWDIAVAVACPVVAIHKGRNEIVVHGGGVHFSKESMADEEMGVHYGQVAKDMAAGWGPLVPGAFLKKLSQEHGTIVGPDDFINKVKLGDLIKVIPVHSCMTANLMRNQTLVLTE
jgi:D-serine deaminase-like pyridoxal phosphate-dependent protein